MIMQTYRTVELSEKLYAGIRRVKCDVWYLMGERNISEKRITANERVMQLYIFQNRMPSLP